MGNRGQEAVLGDQQHALVGQEEAGARTRTRAGEQDRAGEAQVCVPAPQDAAENTSTRCPRALSCPCACACACPCPCPCACPCACAPARVPAPQEQPHAPASAPACRGRHQRLAAPTSSPTGRGRVRTRTSTRTSTCGTPAVWCGAEEERACCRGPSAAPTAAARARRVPCAPAPAPAGRRRALVGRHARPARATRA